MVLLFICETVRKMIALKFKSIISNYLINEWDLPVEIRNTFTTGFVSACSVKRP